MLEIADKSDSERGFASVGFFIVAILTVFVMAPFIIHSLSDVIVIRTLAGPQVPIANAPGYRYKLTLEVEVDGQIKSASNVVDVRYVEKSFPEKHTNIAITGDALFLDLGPTRRPLIALLTAQPKPEDRSASPRNGWGESDPASVVGKAFASEPDFINGQIKAGFGALVGRGPRTITTADLPDLVTFTDINDPKTVMAVNPNNFEASLGEGVKWHSISIEIVDEIITQGIEQRLSWLSSYFDRMLDGHRPGQPNNHSLAANLSTASFLRRGY